MTDARTQPSPGRAGSVLASSAVMAAGTVVSRFSGYVRSPAARRGAGQPAARRPVHHRQHHAEHALHPAGGRRLQRGAGPAAGAGDEPDADGGEAYTNRMITLAGAVPRRVTVVLVVAAPWVMGIFLVLGTTAPSWPPARVDHRVRAVLPAAGLLLRDVRAGRPGAQRPPPVRADDVGADRQQRGRDRGPGRLPARTTAPSPRPTSSAYTSAQEALLGLGATAGIAVQLLVLLPYLRAAGVHYRPALRLPRHRARPHPAARRCGPCCSWSSTRSPTRWWSGWPPAARRRPAARAARRTATGYTVYAQTFLIVMVPHAIDHGLAGHRDAAAAVGARRRRRPARRWPQPGRDAAHRAGACRAVRRAAAGRRARPGRRSLWSTAPRGRPTTTTSCRSRCSARRRLLHRPLPDAARLLRPRAHPHRVLHPVRRSRRPTSSLAVVLVGGTDAEHTAPASGAGLHRVVRRRLGRVLPGAAPRRSAGWRRRRWCGSWCGSRSRPASRRRGLRPRGLLLPGGDDPSHLVRWSGWSSWAASTSLVFLVLARLLRLTEVTEVLDTVTRRLRRRTRARVTHLR